MGFWIWIGILIDVKQGCKDLGYVLGNWELGINYHWIGNLKNQEEKNLPLSYAYNSAYMKACSKSWNSDDLCWTFHDLRKAKHLLPNRLIFQPKVHQELQR